MAANDSAFQGSIPQIYEECLVPIIFDPYATDLAARLRDLERGAVLETASGTGVVARALDAALPPDVRLVATDLNEGMLGVAAARDSSRPVKRMPADAQKLPFADGEFDAVVCQFGMMFLPDKGAGHREARRVLSPRGRFVFNVWGALRDNEASWVLHEAVAAQFPTNAPTFFERVPFGYRDPDRLRADVEGAGFARVTIDVVDHVNRATAEGIARGLCQGTPLRGEIESRGVDLAAMTAKATDALIAHYGSPTFDNRMRALVITASVS